MKNFYIVALMFFVPAISLSQPEWKIDGAGGSFTRHLDSKGLTVKAMIPFKANYSLTTEYEGILPQSIEVTFENKILTPGLFEHGIKLFFIGDSSDSSGVIWIPGPQVFSANPRIVNDTLAVSRLTLSLPENKWGEVVHELRIGFTFRPKLINSEYEMVFKEIILVYEDHTTPIVIAVSENPILPSEFSLAQNYPNPFNPTTTIKFTTLRTEKVSLKIYDILGREVATLVNETKQAGTYTVLFDASKLSSGTYFYRLTLSGGQVEMKKMTFLKVNKAQGRRFVHSPPPQGC